MLLLALAVLAGTYARTAIGPLQEAMRIALSLSDNQIALLQGPAVALPVVMGAVPLGIIIDRYSRVRLLFILAVLSLVGSLITALASGFALLFVARCLTGLTMIATLTAAYSLVADLYEPDQRGRTTMALVVSQMGGNAAAFALGGALLAMSGSGPDGWRWAMMWLVGPLVPVVLLMLVMREPVRTGQVIEKPSTRDAWTQLWAYRAVIAPLAVGIVMAEIAFGAAYVWAAPALSRSFDLPPERVGAIMAFGLMLSGLLGPIAGGTLADVCQRVGGPARTVSVLSALALMSVPAGLFAFAPGVTSASVLFVTFIVILLAAIVMGTTLFTVVIPNELRGLCMAMMFAANTLFGVGLAPMTVSLLSGATGGPATIGKALAWVGVTTGVLGAVSFALARHPAR